MPNDRSDRPPPGGAYVIESIEYVRETPLPPNTLFDDPDELDRLLEYTKQSIESCASTVGRAPGADRRDG
ncbi:hypothetical protein AGRA3207_003412 [Actinomadura graeca]|uniref:Uncharacterized protein n=1 Tax=Actinomadura graeca TaxID=2750812 RepID=A0ABX8QXG1_9ACTN|nr:hypothetical protein [Actinomadura graeca]QXJ22417.1 hypothetical protein AGRA3207_003412 [Actinomadura graeca]